MCLLCSQRWKNVRRVEILAWVHSRCIISATCERNRPLIQVLMHASTPTYIDNHVISNCNDDSQHAFVCVPQRASHPVDETEFHKDKSGDLIPVYFSVQRVTVRISHIEAPLFRYTNEQKSSECLIANHVAPKLIYCVFNAHSKSLVLEDNSIALHRPFKNWLQVTCIKVYTIKYGVIPI